MLALIPLLVVDLILIPISIFGGSPSMIGITLINIPVILILALRFTFLFLWKLRCRACAMSMAMDTGKMIMGMLWSGVVSVAGNGFCDMLSFSGIRKSAFLSNYNSGVSFRL
jgi:hypothetical protein